MNATTIPEDKVLSISDEWPEPMPLHSEYDREPYPVEALPPAIRDAVLEVQESLQAPTALIANSALGVLSVAGQALADVQIGNGLISPTSLYFLTVAEPNERKSACDKLFMPPLRDWQTRKTLELKPELEAYQAALEAWEAEKSGLKSRISQDAKTGKNTSETKRLLKELEQEKPVKPLVPRLHLEDATTEAISISLAKQWPSAGLISAEAGAVFGSHSMAPDKIQAYFSMINKSWSGEPTRVDRKTGDSYELSNVRLTLSLQIQPETLKQFLYRSGGLVRGMGFFARCLVADPESTQGSRLYKEAPKVSPKLNNFRARIEQLLDTELNFANGKLEPPILHLSDEAKQIWQDFHNRIEIKLKPGGELQSVKDVAGKLPDNAARMAALFHMLESGVEGEVSRQAMISATLICSWHLLEAHRFFDVMQLTIEDQNASKLDRWLINEARNAGSTAISRRRAMQYGPLRKKSTLDPALDLLADHYRLRQAQRGNATVLQINPSLMGYPR